MFAPTEDRGAPGSGFTHKQGDLVCVSTEMLGVLENKVTYCNTAPAWTFGIADLMSNLAARGLLAGRRTDAEKRS
jgi:fumarylacetoacetate (FAA) hydrolase family protein